VLGHSKTVLVLLGGWAFLGDTITAKKFGGMALAVSGMVWYGKASAAQARLQAKQLKPQTPEAPPIPSVEKTALLRQLSTGNMRVMVNAGAEPARAAV
jgi:drug/metabolite transporter (DMT)-like permease